MPNWISWLVLESHPVYKTAWRQIGRINKIKRGRTQQYVQLISIDFNCTQLAQGLATVCATVRSPWPVLLRQFRSFLLVSDDVPGLGAWNVIRLHLSSLHVRSLQRFAAPWGLQSLPPLLYFLWLSAWQWVWAYSQRKFSSHTSELRTNVYGQSSYHQVNSEVTIEVATGVVSRC